MNNNFSIKNRQILTLILCCIFTLSGYSNSSCYPAAEKNKVTCDVVIESIEGGSQFLEFTVPKRVKEVEVGVQITVESGAVTAWLEDSMQKKVEVTVKKDQLSAFKGLAKVRESFYDIHNEVFRLYLEPHHDALLKKAKDIKIKIIYGLPNKQNNKLSPVQQLNKVINEKIALNPTKLGVVKLIANQQNQYIATQIFHPFNELKPEQKSKASSLGWESGQSVRIWIFKDWKFQICKSNLKKHEDCSVNVFRKN